jgi:hypothetical protein
VFPLISLFLFLDLVFWNKKITEQGLLCDWGMGEPDAVTDRLFCRVMQI